MENYIKNYIIKQSCDMEDDLLKECIYSVGGINRIIVANRSQIDTVTVDTTPGVNFGSVRDIQMLVTPTPGVYYRFFEIEPAKETGLANAEIVVSGGQKYFTQTVGFTFPGNKQSFIQEMEKIGLANLVVLVESKLVQPTSSTFAGENRWFCYGLNGGLEVATMTAGLGSAPGDIAGYVVTMTGNFTALPAELVPNPANHPTIADLIADLLDDTNN